MICDPDDWLKETAVEELVNFAIDNKLDMVVGDKYDVYINSTSQKKVPAKPEWLKQIKPLKIYSDRKIIQLFSFFNVSPHAKLYKKSISKHIKFPRKVSYTDFLLYLSSLLKVKGIAYYNHALAYYLTDRPGNTCTQKNVEKISDCVTVWNETFKEINQENINNNILIYRLYVQFRSVIMSEYGQSTQSIFDDKYWYQILKILNVLQNYKNELYGVDYIEDTLSKRIFYMVSYVNHLV